MGTFVSPEDFSEALPTVSSGRLLEVITDAEAMATYYAPGLLSATFQADAPKMAQAKAILRAAVIYQCQPANDGDHPRSPTILAPSQIAALRGLTRNGVALGGIYTVTLVPDVDG